MRFISHIRKFEVPILMPQVEYLQGGGTRELVPMLVARFRQGDLTAEELSFAEAKYGREAPGRNLEIDEVTLVPLIGRLSIFDTESDEMQAEFERVDRMMEGQEHQAFPRGHKWEDGDAEKATIAKLLDRAAQSSDFAVIEEIPVPPPWPAYDTFPGSEDDLFEVIVAQGHHLPQVAAYERQNQKRDYLLGLLDMAIEEAKPQGSEVIVA